MVIVNKTIDCIEYSINLRKDLYNVCTINSGDGKTYACRLLIDALKTEGKVGILVDSASIKHLESICKNNHYFLMVLDELEQIDKSSIKLDFLQKHADNIWFIDRGYNTFTNNLCKIMMDGLKVTIVGD